MNGYEYDFIWKTLNLVPEESGNFGHSKHFFLTFSPFLFQNVIFAVEFKLVEMVIFKAKTGKWNEMRIKCVQVMI